jgi:NifU-like protein involved in Fe-S cluster formation
VTATLYSRDILRLAASIPHVGPLEPADGRAEKMSPVCGSRIALGVTLDDDGRVAALGQELRACALGQSSAHLMAAHAPGRALEEIAAARAALAAFLAGTADAPEDWPGLAVFAAARAYPARHGAILLPFDALQAAVEAALSRPRSAPPLPR